MPEPTTTAAVFLSYAREDTDAARRIADALRGFGVEVWFDQNELRGGDTWDQKIRGQIRTCTLFMAVISARTQERPEGYFRREWKIAVERTHDMADGVPFIVPIVIDATAESAALVPEQFMRVQWTRLAGGVPTPEFVAQTKRLLDPSRRTGGLNAGTVAAAVPASPKPGRSPLIAVAAIAVLAIGAAIFFAIRPTTREKPVAEAAKPATEVAAAVPTAPAPPLKIAGKSIAVLPFTNMSEEKDSAFFADGVHEDILTNLALVRDLKVVSRTTVTQYRDSKKTMKQIGDELGVAYILEGSVRRSGNKVRVTGQLINARTDEHVWAKSYDRDLTDIFSIQATLAQEIASALEIAITPQAQQFIERRPTENPLAYDSYLKGRDIRNRSPTGELKGLKEAEQYFQEAVSHDPNFAAAWGELAVVHALNVFWDFDHTPSRLAQADAAVAHAVRLAPEVPDVIRSIGTYAYYAYRDYARATENYEKIARLQPNDPTVFSSLALIQRRQGHWADSLANSRRAVQLEPANLSYARSLVSSLRLCRRWDEALEAQRHVIALTPGRLEEEQLLAVTYFNATGSEKEMNALFARQTPAVLESPKGIDWRKSIAFFHADFAEFKRLDQLQPFYDEDGEAHIRQAANAAGAYFSMGDIPGAQARVANFPAEARAQLLNEPANARLWADLGFMELFLGHPDEALRCLRKPTEILPESLDALDGPRYSEWLASLYTRNGEKDRAIAEYSRLLQIPGFINVYGLKIDPWYASLRDDPRWAALLNDPKNNAPLF